MNFTVARGIRKSSGIVTVAAAATPENLYTQSTGGQNNRTIIPRKVMIYNATGVDAVVDIGTGIVGFANIIPSLVALTGFDSEWSELDIPEVEVNGNLTVQSSVLGVQVQVEVEEIEL